MSDGARPEAGGWNRVHLIVDDLQGEVARLRAAGAQFRNGAAKLLAQLRVKTRKSSGDSWSRTACGRRDAMRDRRRLGQRSLWGWIVEEIEEGRCECGRQLAEQSAPTRSDRRSEPH
jgi:hypothetical protein